MATRSRIGIRIGNETRSIYCHWDGYLENNGRILLEHYSDRNKVEELISLGDISSLRESIGKPFGHSFDTPVEGHTVFYHRDRNENWDNVQPQTFTKTKSLSQYMADCKNYLFSEEYAYVFDTKINKWKYWSGKGWRLLTKKNTTEKI